MISNNPSPSRGLYPPIAEHALIGDLQTAALVSSDGTIDWFCSPRFDSPSVFASLLDCQRGGSFRIAPTSGEHTIKQMYFPDTAVLITRFMTSDGVAEIVDQQFEFAAARDDVLRVRVEDFKEFALGGHESTEHWDPGNGSRDG